MMQYDIRNNIQICMLYRLALEGIGTVVFRQTLNESKITKQVFCVTVPAVNSNFPRPYCHILGDNLVFYCSIF